MTTTIEVDSARMVSRPANARLAVLGRGNNGAVLQSSAGSVYKWTVDPHETAVWLAVQSMRNSGRPVLGFPEIFDIRLGDREALIHREDVTPLGKRERYALDPWAADALKKASRWTTAGRLEGNRSLILRGRKSLDTAMAAPMLRSLRTSIFDMRRMYSLEPTDLRPDNLGHGAGRRDSILVTDPGRTPLETALVDQGSARGEAHRRCPNERGLRTAVLKALGKSPTYGNCRIANAAELSAVMQKHGWKAHEVSGTAGFHTEPNCTLRGCTPGDVIIREGNDWSLLHEFVHAAGVVDRSLAPWITEGITEAVAQEIAAIEGWEHHPTYPHEVTVVREKLAPNISMTVLEVGQLVVNDPTAAGRELAKKMSEGVGGSTTRWYNAVGPGAADSRRFTKALQAASRRR